MGKGFARNCLVLSAACAVLAVPPALAGERWQPGSSMTCTDKKGEAVRFTGNKQGLIASYDADGGGEIHGRITQDGALDAVWVETKADKKCATAHPVHNTHYWGPVRGKATATGFAWTWSYCNETKQKRWTGTCGDQSASTSRRALKDLESLD